MLDNAKYNKVKILHDLSGLCWFIEKHALADAQKSNDTECISLLENLKKELEKQIDLFQKIAHK
mgnify:CR=1 FL=1